LEGFPKNLQLGKNPVGGAPGVTCTLAGGGFNAETVACATAGIVREFVRERFVAAITSVVVGVLKL
jgi:hypothetical protein